MTLPLDGHFDTKTSLLGILDAEISVIMDDDTQTTTPFGHMELLSGYCHWANIVQLGLATGTLLSLVMIISHVMLGFV